MSARSFANLAKLQLPVCPHRFANWSNVMTLYLNKIYDGHRQDFFQCVTHKCCFIGQCSCFILTLSLINILSRYPTGKPISVFD
jgi:hypothetical protein